MKQIPFILMALILLQFTLSCKKENTNKIVTDKYTVSTVPGYIHEPIAAAADPSGNVYAIEFFNDRIRKIASTGGTSTFAESVTGFSTIATDFNGNVYATFGPCFNCWDCVRMISPDGSASSIGCSNAVAYFYGVTVDAKGIVYFVDVLSQSICKINQTGQLDTVGASIGLVYGTQPYVTIDSTDNIYFSTTSDLRADINKITLHGDVSKINKQPIESVSGLACDKQGNIYYANSDRNRIEMMSPSGEITVIAGGAAKGHADGDGSVALFNYPKGLTRDVYGNMFVADFLGDAVRKISLK